MSIKQFGVNRERVQQIMEKLPFRVCRYDEKGREASNFNINSKQLWLYMKQFGKSKDKFIPNWILDLPIDKIKMFWDAYTFALPIFIRLEIHIKMGMG